MCEITDFTPYFVTPNERSSGELGLPLFSGRLSVLQTEQGKRESLKEDARE